MSDFGETVAEAFDDMRVSPPLWITLLGRTKRGVLVDRGESARVS